MGHGGHFGEAAKKLKTPLLLEQQEIVIAAAEDAIKSLAIKQEIIDEATGLVKTALSAILSGQSILLAGI